jgi:hypothetical protein
MELAPQSEWGFRIPTPEMPRVMQPHVGANAQRNPQGLRISFVAMVNDEPTRRPTCSASEPVTFKNQLPQNAEPAQRVVLR